MSEAHLGELETEERERGAGRRGGCADRDAKEQVEKREQNIRKQELTALYAISVHRWANFRNWGVGTSHPLHMACSMTRLFAGAAPHRNGYLESLHRTA